MGVGDGDELLEEDADDEDKLSSEELLTFTAPLLLVLVFRGEVVSEVHGFLAGGMATIWSNKKRIKQRFYIQFDTSNFFGFFKQKWVIHLRIQNTVVNNQEKYLFICWIISYVFSCAARTWCHRCRLFCSARRLSDLRVWWRPHSKTRICLIDSLTNLTRFCSWETKASDRCLTNLTRSDWRPKSQSHCGRWRCRPWGRACRRFFWLFLRSQRVFGCSHRFRLSFLAFI